MKEMVKYGFILGIICFAASGILAVVNAVTEPRIEIEKKKEVSLALKEVMPNSAGFKEVLKDGTILYYKTYDGTGHLNGFAIKSEAKGYSSTIEVMAGFGLDLKIINIRILSQNETPGLGARITEPKFAGQFNGKDLASLSKVDTITGATISSSAVIKAVESKIMELKDALLIQTQ